MDGPEGPSTHRSRAVIAAVGFLNRPNLPGIEGRAEFAGPSWHNARWPEGFELKGKRIAVIGTGATGYQTIPEIALEAEHVVVFQRTPSWLFAARGYRSPFPPQVNWLDRNFPYFTNLSRHRTLYPATFAALTDIDPEFEDPHVLSLVNKQLRDASIEFLERKLGDPDLVAKMTPEYPVLGARRVIVDPEFSVLDAILRENVTLVTEAAVRIDRTGVFSGDGNHYEVDAIVYATGFHATEYLFPMSLTGRGGLTIDELWREGGARVHRFCMVPGFPNLWSLYGPNTDGGIGPGLEPTASAYWEFAKRIDEANAGKVWSDRRVHSYYWTQHGRSATMCRSPAPTSGARCAVRTSASSNSVSSRRNAAAMPLRRSADHGEPLNLRSTRHQAREPGARRLEVLALAVRRERLGVVVQLHHQVLPRVVLAERVELVAGLLASHVGGEAEHDLLELGFLAGRDLELGDDGEHGFTSIVGWKSGSIRKVGILRTHPQPRARAEPPDRGRLRFDHATRPRGSRPDRLKRPLPA